MRFSRQEYWSGLPCPPPGALASPASTGGFFTTSTIWEAGIIMVMIFFLRDEFLSAPEFHINRIIQLIFFCIKLLDSTQSFCYSSLLLLLQSIVHSFSLLNSIQLYDYNTVFYFLINGYLGYFQFLALL